MSGPEMILQAFIKLIGIDPKQVWEGFEDIRVRVVTFDERLARFEAQQNEILAVLDHLREDKIDEGTPKLAIARERRP